MHPQLNLSYQTIENIIYYLEELKGHTPQIQAYKYSYPYPKPPVHSILYTFNGTFYTHNLDAVTFARIKKGYFKLALNSTIAK